jgi:hypothetical protein
MALDGTRGGLRVSLVVHLMSLEVDLGYVIDDLASFLAPSEKSLQPGLGLLARLLLLLLLTHSLGVKGTGLPLLMRGYKLLLRLPLKLLTYIRLVSTTFHC